MNPAQATAAYIGLSLAFALLAKPGYDTFSAIWTLLGGTTGSLALSISAASDIFESLQDADLYYWTEAFTVCAVALFLWLTGGALVFSTAKRKWKITSHIVPLIVIWVIGSAFNIFFFGLRSL